VAAGHHDAGLPGPGEPADRRADAVSSIGGGTVVAAMTSDATGYAIVAWGPMWITADGGRAWTQVTVR
jgi:hypothetical protein